MHPEDVVMQFVACQEDVWANAATKHSARRYNIIWAILGMN
jgi:hypothetical protein